MPPAKKRKIVDESKGQDDAPVEETTVPESQSPQHINQGSEAKRSGDPQLDLRSVDKNQERKERFRALQARAVFSQRPITSECPCTDLSIAKLRSEESQRSSRRVTTTSHRP